jgi:diguanylate cyclase (GGDEF)-like protein/PAS domain S-box-containing protein
LVKALPSAAEGLSVTVRATFDFVRFAGNSSDVAIVIDSLGTILAVSHSVSLLLGYASDDQVGRNVVEYVHPDELDLAVGLLAAAKEIAGQTASISVKVKHAAGHWVPFEVLPLNLLSTDGFIVLTGRDVSERHRLQRQTESDEKRFRALATSAPVAIFHIDLDGNCEFVNDRWTELSGQVFNDALGQGWISIIDRQDQLKLASIRDGLENSGMFSMSLHTKSGLLRSVVGRWTALFDEVDGRRTGYVGTIEDVTEQRALEALLMHQATHDSLTGLPIRVVLHEHLVHSLARAERGGHRVGAIFVDLDRFKVVNDSLGHEAGDRLLTAVASRMTSSLRATDIVGRFGGDEFVVIAEGKNDQWILELTARIQSIFVEPFELGIGQPYSCTASIGIALSVPGSTPETLMRDADAAMYRAKERGRGRAEQFDARMRERAVDRLALESDLRRAVSADELVVLYQPIVRSAGRSLTAVEALVRWNHPVRGLLSPEAFIGIAEETGLILPLGDWILERACRDLADADNVTLNVNLSARQFHDELLVDRITDLVGRTGFSPNRLRLEITESVLASNFDEAIGILGRLKSLGVSIAVDDFGTGYSSLNYLSKFPVDSLKIDRSFIQGLGSQSGDSHIVRTVIALAHALDLTATAEGVETEGQLAELCSLGCDFAQGYFFDKPVSLERLRSVWLSQEISPAP